MSDQFKRPAAKPPEGLPSRYSVRQHLGQGGMANVWLAVDRRLERQVAIKSLRSRYRSDSKIRERFRREGVAAARVEHANLVPVHDVFVVGDAPYIVTGYMPGGSLFQRVRSHGPLEVEEFLRITRGILRGLRCIHDLGVVHRDVKPANVLLDGDGEARLGDFGVAHLAEEMRITGTLEVVGTPIYMAPESLRGEPAEAGSDLFSLGRTLVFAASGSVRRNRLPDGFPRGLHSWLAGILALRPELRALSARECLEDLESALQGERSSGGASVERIDPAEQGLDAETLIGDLLQIAQLDVED
jgi:serine/threonine protein kinase